MDYRPDGLLGTSTSAFVGNDIYNATGVNQSLSQRVPRRGTAVFRWRIQNDGASADLGYVISLDSQGSAYVTGRTFSSGSR